jgi:hypothetical protein
MAELPRSIEATDLDGDGKLDVIANYDRGTFMENEQVLVVYRGRGDGSLEDPILVPYAGRGVNLHTGDLNGDTRGDLVLCNRDSRAASVLLGRGDGTFLAPVSYPVDGGCWAMALADLNGDGHLDLCLGSDKPRIVIFPGRGDGTFGPSSTFDTSGTSDSMWVTDVTADGRVDLVATSHLSGTIGIVPGQGDGTFGAWLESPAAFFPGDLVGVADLDDDGIPDAAVWDGARLHVLLGQGDGHFQIGPVYPMPDTGAPAILADLNGDGRTDIGTLVQVNGALQWEVFSNQRCRP